MTLWAFDRPYNFSGKWLLFWYLKPCSFRSFILAENRQGAPPKIQEGFEIPITQSVESVEGEKVVVSAKEDEVVEKFAVENVAEVEKD